ncbi:ATP-binding protein [Pontibacillus sp. HMF3514]|uniref:ATP-binding protein n=1 Tax=Pontibacillus sp. HMF3514 TaxID=2692425 RepID=UPI0013204943|nr:ATP-binding protein [Pontibacillus sp. HMF3514]QHE51678.1 ATP-binding protein [Pontibacillus sp. HMF3514]
MTVTKTKKVPPHAKRTIEGLRDTGYDFNTAIADIIDNSIAANASLINIDSEMDFEGNITIYICDNGTGMSEEGLDKAMTYGSPERNNPKSLGKFGLGLKTSSTSFCRRLSVTTRNEESEGIYKACWDLDHVGDVGDWELLYLEPTNEELELLYKTAKGNSGTVVTWEKVDRLLKDYQDPGGTYARRAMDKLIASLKEHIAMVYQRFLDNNNPTAENVSIFVQGEEIEAWDPFCTQEENTELVGEHTQNVEFEDGTQTSFTVKAYVLPRKEEFSTEESWKNAKLRNDLQGFYIYRENRLIHFGNWLGMFSNEPHGTLLRVEFSFDYLMDEAFDVDIKKSRVLLNRDLFDWLKKEFLPAPRRAANDRYRVGKKQNVKSASKNAHTTSNVSIGNHEKEVQISNVEVTNKENNNAEVTNSKGKVHINLPILDPVKDGEFHVSAVDSIEDGVLWEPALIGKHHAVRINTNHDYYQKVYLPNLNSGVTIQGMDSLLWAICEAELGTINEDTKFYLRELRIEVSRILRRLVQDLPEPELEDE